MSAEEFENYCNGLMDVESSSSNVLKLIETNLKVLNELKDKQKLLKQETLKLQTDITIFRQLMQNKFNACLNNNKENYTQNVPGYLRNSGGSSLLTTATAAATAATSTASTQNNVLDDIQDLAKFNATTSAASDLLTPLRPTTTSDKTVVETAVSNQH